MPWQRITCCSMDASLTVRYIQIPCAHGCAFLLQNVTLCCNMQ